MAKAMCYHAEYFNHPDSDQAEGSYHAMGKVRDVFDGEWYQSMLHTPMVLKGEAFILHAQLLSVFGDMLAIAKVMWMKGHNGIAACHCCKITGLRIPDTHSSAHYVPLDQSRHPHVKDDIHVYDAAKLPLWTHDEMLSQAAKVDAVPNITQANRLETKNGINGTPALAQLTSILLP